MRRPILKLTNCLAIAFAAPLGAQAPVLPAEAPPAIEILPVDFSGGKLGGPGGDRLKADLTTARFIALGEDHGLAGPPQFAAALAHAAQQVPGEKPLYHAVEVGPISARWAQNLLAKDGVAALDKAHDGRAMIMPFISNVEDADLALDFAQRGRLFGIDQEFVGAPMLLLEMLAARTKDSALQAELRARSQKDATSMTSGQFNDLSIMTISAADYAALKAKFPGDRKAQEIITALAASAEIYRLNNVGRFLENNELRAALIQKYFLTAWQSPSFKRPRVIFKMGASHMGRGITPPYTYDIGSLLPGLAASEGRTSLHIAYIPLAGKIRAVRPNAGKLTAVTEVTDRIVGPILTAAGIDPATLPTTGHVLIPMAAVRQTIASNRKLGSMTHEMRFYVLGFDYLVTTRDAVAATNFEAN